jgi:hypothetical protein
MRGSQLVWSAVQNFRTLLPQVVQEHLRSGGESLVLFPHDIQAGLQPRFQRLEAKRVICRGVRQLVQAGHTNHSLLGQDCYAVNDYDIHADTLFEFQVKKLQRNYAFMVRQM